MSIEDDVFNLKPEALPSVKPGGAYDADLSNIAINATWSLFSGSLPTGLTLDPSGHLGGTCDASATPDTYAFIAQAVDRKGRKGLVAESITVTGPKRDIPAKSGCSAASGNVALFALVPVLLLLRRRRRGAFVGAALALALPGLAHASYSKTSSTISYQPVSGGITLTAGVASSANLNLPFSFRFFGQSYSSVSVGTSGYLAFTGSANVAAPAFGNGVPILAVWGDNLTVSGATTPAGSVTYVINGVTPNREVVIQWANAYDTTDLNGFPASNTSFNFQAHLHEDGQIDFTYGDATTDSSTSTSAAAAIAGLSDGANNTVSAFACSGGFGHCGYTDWPTNTELVFIAGTDLALDNLTTDGVAYQGSSTNLVATVSNPGGQNVATTGVQFILSTDTVLGNADDQIVGEQDNLALNAGQVKIVTQPYELGALPEGSYFFFAKVDPTNAISEDDETNNVYGPVRLDVTAPAPDFTLSGLTVSAHTAAPGDSIHVSFTLHNQGTVASSAVSWGVYLSTNNVISLADLQVGSGTAQAINPQGVDSIATDVAVPSTLAPGSYYLGVIANPTLAVTETNALNDTAFDPTTINVTSTSLALVGEGALPATSAGAIYSFVFTASGGDGHYTFTSSALPAGLQLAANGTLSGRPTTATGSPFSLAIHVADGAGHTATGNYTLAVSDGSLALTLLSAQVPEAEYAAAYQQALSATGGTAPYTWSLTGEGRLPGGLLLDPNGALEGVARESGTFNFGVKVTDAASTPASATAQLQLVVSGSSLFLRAADPNLPDATLDQPYNQVLGVSGGFPPYGWQFPYCPDPTPANCKPVVRFPQVPTDGQSQAYFLPAGMYFGCDFTGAAFLTSNPPNIPPDQDGGSPCYDPGLAKDAPNVPEEAGIFAIPARVSDSANQSIEVMFTLRVGDGAGLTVTTTQLPDALTGKAYTAALQASSPKSQGAIHWTIACSERDQFGAPVSPCPETLPPGLTLADDGTITGTPTDSSGKTYTFMVRANDDENRVDVRALAITSRAPTPAAKSSCQSGPGTTGLVALMVPLLLLALRRRKLRAGDDRAGLHRHARHRLRQEDREHALHGRDLHRRPHVRSERRCVQVRRRGRHRLRLEPALRQRYPQLPGPDALLRGRELHRQHRVRSRGRRVQVRRRWRRGLQRGRGVQPREPELLRGQRVCGSGLRGPPGLRRRRRPVQVRRPGLRRGSGLRRAGRRRLCGLAVCGRALQRRHVVRRGHGQLPLRRRALRCGPDLRVLPRRRRAFGRRLRRERAHVRGLVAVRGRGLRRRLDV